MKKEATQITNHRYKLFVGKDEINIVWRYQIQASAQSEFLMKRVFVLGDKLEIMTILNGNVKSQMYKLVVKKMFYEKLKNVREYKCTQMDNI